MVTCPKLEIKTNARIIKCSIVAVFCMFEVESIILLASRIQPFSDPLNFLLTAMMLVVANLLIYLAVFYDTLELKLKKIFPKTN